MYDWQFLLLARRREAGREPLTWEKAVLSRVADPSECQKVIEERQAAVDDLENRFNGSAVAFKMAMMSPIISQRRVSMSAIIRSSHAAS